MREFVYVEGYTLERRRKCVSYDGAWGEDWVEDTYVSEDGSNRVKVRYVIKDLMPQWTAEKPRAEKPVKLKKWRCT